MKALVFDQVGPPLDVLELRDVPLPPRASGDVLVKISVASINPGDFLFIQGLYPPPKIPELPQQVAGTGGSVGVVTDSGGAEALPPGTPVFFSYLNGWAEYAAVPAQWLIPISPRFGATKAAQLGNIITAWDLLEMSGVRRGQWLAVTAANSSVASMVTQFARHLEVRVLCIVRRAQPDLDLREMGASAILELDGLDMPIDEAVANAIGHAPIDAVVDCVGGPLLSALVRSAGMGAQIVIYGGFSPERFELHNFDLLLKAADIRSYAYRYFFDPPPPQDRPRLEQIMEMAARDDFRVRVGGLHPVNDFRVAISDTIERPERGKHYFELADSVRSTSFEC